MAKTGETWEYTYNAAGLRTKRVRTVGETETTWEYIYSGSQLAQMTKGTDTLTFTYDANGTPTALNHNGTVYYYVTNLQGDIIAILNGNGIVEAEYTYDAWGNPISQATSGIGALNPLRYRGYVWDAETQLYYLQSRYYDPEIGRFLNADDLICTDTSIIMRNLFSYCENNPVMGYDPTGHWNWGGFAVGAAIAMAGIAIITTVVLAPTLAPLAITAAKGFVMAVGIATTATGAVTCYAAAAEKTMVVDVSTSNGATHDKTGYSVVVDFDTTSATVETYYHYGKTSDEYGAAYGVGLVDGYEEQGDYGGYFADGGAYTSCGGFNYGFDFCTDPSAPLTNCSAALMTIGTGFTAVQDGKITVYGGVDYYVPVSYFKWG